MLPLETVERDLPIESSSSIKIMHGDYWFAYLNKSRTRYAPTPTYFSTKDDAETDKNETPASPATALANNVFPVPGGPKSKTPFGIFAPIYVNFWGYFKNWTISTSSSLASSIPATLSNRI